MGERLPRFGMGGVLRTMGGARKINLFSSFVDAVGIYKVNLRVNAMQCDVLMVCDDVIQGAFRGWVKELLSCGG